MNFEPPENTVQYGVLGVRRDSFARWRHGFVLTGAPRGNVEVGLKQRLLLGVLVLCAMLCAGSGGRAEGFCVGFGFGLPTFAEVQLGYAEQDFGVSVYSGSFLITALGVDGYGRVPTDWVRGTSTVAWRTSTRGSPKRPGWPSVPCWARSGV